MTAHEIKRAGPKLKRVSKAEHDAFVANYPRPLEAAVLTICQPERMQYNDFTLGDWPASVVASYSLWGCHPTNIWAQVPGKWQILKEIP